MKTLFDLECREEVARRLDKLGPQSTRHWGTMTVPRALSHMGDQLALALGEIEVKPVRGPMGWPPFNLLAIYFMPWPKNVKTAPELLQTRIEDIDEARQRLMDLIHQFVARGEQGQFTAHPLFGRLGGRAWAHLAYRHLDHHLRQFGA